MFNKFIKRMHDQNKQSGFVISLCSLLALVFFIMTSFVIDIGNARYNLRNIQIAADASSLAALVALGSGTNYNLVRAEVNDMALRNHITQAEIDNNQIVIDCGIWSAGAFTSQGKDGTNTPICNAATNAVKVNITRHVKTFFGQVMNTETLSPNVFSISSQVPASECIRPFVVRDAQISGVAVGQTFSIDGSGAGNGNWGKLDYAGNGSHWNMAADVCNSNIYVGGIVPAQTGTAGVGNAFDAIEGNSYGENFIAALTSTVMSGNTNVTIIEFIRLTLVSTNGRNGQPFEATLRIEARNVVPNPNLANPKRTLVK